MHHVLNLVSFKKFTQISRISVLIGSLLFLCNLGQAQITILIPLGSLSGINAGGDTQNSQFPPREVFNGVTGSSTDGWIASDSAVKRINWEVNPFENVTVFDQADFDFLNYDIIQYTLTIYTGISVFGYGELNQFSLQVAGEGNDFNSYVTSFESLSSEYVSAAVDKTIAISSDSAGLITATDTAHDDGQVRHTIVFNAPSSTRRFQLESAIDGAGPNRFSFSIEEIEISGVAIPVPEPSTYALVLGLTLFGLVAFRCRLSPSSRYDKALNLGTNYALKTWGK
jgi:hypothetical protein